MAATSAMFTNSSQCTILSCKEVAAKTRQPPGSLERLVLPPACVHHHRKLMHAFKHSELLPQKPATATHLRLVLLMQHHEEGHAAPAHAQHRLQMERHSREGGRLVRRWSEGLRLAPQQARLAHSIASDRHTRASQTPRTWLVPEGSGTTKASRSTRPLSTTPG